MPNFSGNDVEQANIRKDRDNENVDIKYTVGERERADVGTGSGDALQGLFEWGLRYILQGNIPAKHYTQVSGFVLKRNERATDSVLAQLSQTPVSQGEK